MIKSPFNAPSAQLNPKGLNMLNGFEEDLAGIEFGYAGLGNLFSEQVGVGDFNENIFNPVIFITFSLILDGVQIDL